MSRMNQWLLLVIGASLPLMSTQALTSEPAATDRDYRVIVERNPFGLKPPPPPPTNAPPKEAAKDEILLTGIVSLGEPSAYFQTKPPQNKPPEFYKMHVGDKQEGLEVLEIDPVAKSVRVRNAGVETVMTFASHGVKPPVAPATPATAAPGTVPGARPGVLPLPGAATTTPGVGATPATRTAASSATSGSSRIRTIPSRTVRTAQPGFSPGGAFAPGGAMSAPVQPPNPNAPLQDALMMELQKRANPNVIFPPTPMPPGGR